jgi:hypothetical protein
MLAIHPSSVEALGDEGNGDGHGMPKMPSVGALPGALLLLLCLLEA